MWMSFLCPSYASSYASAPIIGVIVQPIPPTIDVRLPVVAGPALRLVRPLLLPGGLGRWQVCRRARRWLRASLPPLLEARRAAAAENVFSAIRDAEQHFHRQVTAIAERTIAATPVRDAAGDTDGSLITDLRRLRSALLADRNAD
jgi:hypothetical protein